MPAVWASMHVLTLTGINDQRFARLCQKRGAGSFDALVVKAPAPCRASLLIDIKQRTVCECDQ